MRYQFKHMQPVYEYASFHTTIDPKRATLGRTEAVSMYQISVFQPESGRRRRAGHDDVVPGKTTEGRLCLEVSHFQSRGRLMSAPSHRVVPRKGRSRSSGEIAQLKP